VSFFLRTKSTSKWKPNTMVFNQTQKVWQPNTMSIRVKGEIQKQGQKKRVKWLIDLPPNHNELYWCLWTNHNELHKCLWHFTKPL